jgi:hypothetical protein
MIYQLMEDFMKHHLSKLITVTLFFTMYFVYMNDTANIHAQNTSLPVTVPKVISILPMQKINENQVSFVVYFNQPVHGIDINDFLAYTKTQFEEVASIENTEDLNSYIVHVNSTYLSREVILLLIDDDSIKNSHNIPLGGTGEYNGNAISKARIQTEMNSKTSRNYDYNTSVGAYNSITLTSRNIPIISYQDGLYKHLKLAICLDINCSKSIVKTIDNGELTNEVGYYSSISITSNDIPIISYHDRTDGSLKLAICNNLTCTRPTIRTIDSLGNVGLYTSIALTKTNLPVISYFDDTNGSLKLAKCYDLNCYSYSIRVVDSFTCNDFNGMYNCERMKYSVGAFSSLVLTSNELPIIRYYVDFLYDSYDYFKISMCATADCSTIANVKYSNRYAHENHSSIAITSDNRVVMSTIINEHDGLHIDVCSDTDCNSNYSSYLNIKNGTHTSVKLTKSNIPIISYVENNNSLHLIICNDTNCSAPITRSLVTPGYIQPFASLAISSTNIPVISYNAGALGIHVGKPIDQYLTDTLIVDKGQPNSFNKISPQNSDIVRNNTSVTLSWEGISNAEAYEYCYSTSINTCTNWTEVGSNTYVTVDNLNHNTYYWQVRGRNINGLTYSNSGLYWQFKVVLPPKSFQKLLPSNNAINQKTNITLSWRPSERATSYEYCIGDCIKWINVGNKLSVNIPNLSRNKTYFWQVRAKNRDGITISADGYWRFTTAR